MIGSIILYLLLLLLVLYSRKKGSLTDKLGFKKDIGLSKESVIGIAYVAVLIAISIAVGLIFYQLGMQQDLQKTTKLLKGIPIHEVLTVLLIGSFVEEVFFRGYLQQRTNLWVASFIFGFFHVIYGSIAEVTGAILLGIALGYEYKLTDGVYSPIISHMAYNLIVISAVMLA